MPAHPCGLLEPCAATSGTHGSEEGGAGKRHPPSDDPSPAQARALERHAGAARFAFNWALAQVKANLAQRKAERSYGVTDEDLTPASGWSLPALRRAWNQAKHEVAPWWAECSKEGFGGFGGRPPR
jgi:hypothetical protein